MNRVLLLGVVLAVCGCGVATPTASTKPEPPKVEPTPEPAEVYDKVAPMPREAKPK